MKVVSAHLLRRSTKIKTQRNIIKFVVYTDVKLATDKVKLASHGKRKIEAKIVQREGAERNM